MPHISGWSDVRISEPTEQIIHEQIKTRLRSEDPLIGAYSIYDVAEIRLAGKFRTMDEKHWCDPTVRVFTNSTLEISKDAGNNAVDIKLTRPRDYIVRHKCEIVPMWNQGHFGYEWETLPRTSYRHINVPAGSTGLSVSQYAVDLYDYEGYSVVPSVDGNAKRYFVHTQHAHCTHSCELHDNYSSDQTISNPECRPVYRIYHVRENPRYRTGGTLLNPFEEYNCKIHGDGNLNRVCAANRTRGISVKQEYNYPREMD